MRLVSRHVNRAPLSNYCTALSCNPSNTPLEPVVRRQPARPDCRPPKVQGDGQGAASAREAAQARADAA
jgi:hypothetical protein